MKFNLYLIASGFGVCIVANSNQQIYIFISSSMPTHSVQQWLQQARQANAAVAMRGLIHNSFVKTTRWLS